MNLNRSNISDANLRPSNSEQVEDHQTIQTLPNREGLYPLGKEEEATLIPLIITHMDDQPSWNLLGTPLTLPMPNKAPSEHSNLSSFQKVAKKMWYKMM